MQASSVPTLMLVAQINAVLIFCLLHWSAFAVDFAILRSHFLVPPDGPKMGRESAFFCSFTKLCMWSPCLGSFFKVFCIRVAEAQCFGFNETLRLMATGQLGRPF